MTGKWLLDEFTRCHFPYLEEAIDKALKAAREEAMKEAARICREQKGAIAGEINKEWNECCELNATKIEQQLTQ
jgi:hypothetical protein